MQKKQFMQKTVNNFCKKNEQFYLIQKTNFMNAVNRFEYTVNMMGRVQILLMQKQILSMQNNIFDYCEIQT